MENVNAEALGGKLLYIYIYIYKYANTGCMLNLMRELLI